jgi:hypothetical protein
VPCVMQYRMSWAASGWSEYARAGLDAQLVFCAGLIDRVSTNRTQLGGSHTHPDCGQRSNPNAVIEPY